MGVGIQVGVSGSVGGLSGGLGVNLGDGICVYIHISTFPFFNSWRAHLRTGSFKT